MLSDSPAGTFPTEGIEEWLELVDQSLQGLQHSLSNRLGSLSALVELHQMGDLGDAGPVFDNLAREVHKLEDCNRLVRLLPRDRVSGEESVMLSDVVADVLTIHRFLHDLRETQLTVVPVRYVEPIRIERWALIRVLTILLSDAKKIAAGRGAVQLVTRSDEQWVYVELRGSGFAEAETFVPGPYAPKLAQAMGGEIVRRAEAIELRLPTLKARRAADRR